MSQQQARVCADDNCVTWAAAESSRTWAVPGHRSTPIFLTIFYPFIQTSLETYAHDIGFMTQAEYAAAHCPCPGLSSFLWVELPAYHFPNTVCSSQLWAESHFQKSHTGQILYSGLTQPWKVTVTFVGESKKKKPVEEHWRERLHPYWLSHSSHSQPALSAYCAWAWRGQGEGRRGRRKPSFQLPCGWEPGQTVKWEQRWRGQAQGKLPAAEACAPWPTHLLLMPSKCATCALTGRDTAWKIGTSKKQ